MGREEDVAVLNEAFGLDGVFVRVNPSLWGRTMYIVKEEETQWMYKLTNRCYTRETLENACATSSGAPAAGGVSTSEYRKTRDGHYTHSLNSHYWICIAYCTGATDIEHSSAGRENKRLNLARAIGRMHALPVEQLSSPSFQDPPEIWCTLDTNGVWDFIGTTEARLLSCGEEIPISAGVLNFVSKERGSRIDALPKRASTGDMQIKNVLCEVNGEPDACMLINTEIMIPMPRMWDVLWLLMLNDAAAGVQDNGFLDATAPQTWVNDFAYALVVYQEYSGMCFTEEEVFLFHNMLQVKIAQIAYVLTDLCPVLTKVFWAAHNNREKLREIFSSCAKTGVPPPVPLIEGRAEAPRYENLVKALEEKDLSVKVPLLLHFNGTFMPVHVGHIETALVAAKHAERTFGGTVVGVMFSVCCAEHALSKDRGASESLVRLRPALMHMAIHSKLKEADDLREYNPFVDTYELDHCYPGDLSRVAVCCKRFREMTNGRGLVCMVAGYDFAGCHLPWVGGYLDVDDSVRAVVSLREPGMAVPPTTSFGIPSTQFFKQSKLTTFPLPTMRSSTQVRSSQDAVTTGGIFSVGASLQHLC